MDVQKHIAIFQEMVNKTPEEIDVMANSGMFNTIIKGYVALAMEQAGFTQDDISKLDFYYLFDTKTATEARERGAAL